MSKVVLFKGAARFDAANRYVDELAEGLRACGREVVTLHDGEPGFSERLRRELDFRCEFAAGFDGAGSLVEGPDPFIGGRIPRIHLSLEHPAYHWSQFHLADHHWCTADRSVLPFAERAFGGRRPLHFLPMGATPPEGEPAWGERHGIVFAGGYEDPDAIMARWRRHFTSDLAELLQLMAAHAVAHPEKPLLAALEEVFAANDFPGGEELLRRYVPSAYVEVDRAVRNYRRLMVLRALDDAGMAVDLFGPGWRAACFDHHRDHGPLAYNDLLAHYREAAVVLDIAPHLESGPHERMLTAMAHGACTVAAANPWTDENLADERELLTYRWDELERLPEELAWVMGSAVRRESVAGLGRYKVLQAHTWRHRARELLEWAAAVRDEAA